MPTLPPIANLQAFEAVARRRSFALAAAELNLTASAISHQVSRLEAQLDVRLFERSAHGVRLSPAGEHYLMHVGAALNAIATATDDLRQGIRNSLYVHTAPSIASLWLMPRLHHFAQAYPEISLNLSAAHTPSDFALGQADIDIRYGIPQWGDRSRHVPFRGAVPAGLRRGTASALVLAFDGFKTVAHAIHRRHDEAVGRAQVEQGAQA